MTSEMTCKERLMATINFEPTDRVPIVFRNARARIMQSQARSNH